MQQVMRLAFLAVQCRVRPLCLLLGHGEWLLVRVLVLSAVWRKFTMHVWNVRLRNFVKMCNPSKRTPRLYFKQENGLLAMTLANSGVLMHSNMRQTKRKQ